MTGPVQHYWLKPDAICDLSFFMGGKPIVFKDFGAFFDFVRDNITTVSNGATVQENGKPLAIWVGFGKLSEKASSQFITKAAIRVETSAAPNRGDFCQSALAISEFVLNTFGRFYDDFEYLGRVDLSSKFTAEKLEEGIEVEILENVVILKCKYEPAHVKSVRPTEKLRELQC